MASLFKFEPLPAIVGFGALFVGVVEVLGLFFILSKFSFTLANVSTAPVGYSLLPSKLPILLKFAATSSGV